MNAFACRWLAMAIRRPLTAFFVLTFGLTWLCWSVPALGYRHGVGSALAVLGGFGPCVAAAIMTRLTGGSVKSWFRGLFRWRVAARWYAYALGVPIALVVLVTAEFAAVGESLQWSLLDDRLLVYLPSLLIVAAIAGGNEEPGWRGFALPRLQQRLSPIRATLLLGALWAPWHLPLLFAAEGSTHQLPIGGVLVLVALTMTGIVGYTFAYTYLFNRTRSVLLCIIMHAGFNTALASAGLRNEQALQRWDYVLMLGLTTATVWAGVALLIKLTHGRLGQADQPPQRARDHVTPTSRVPARV